MWVWSNAELSNPISQGGHSSICLYPFNFFFRAKQASVQRELCGSTMGEQHIDQRACPKNQRPELQVAESQAGSVSLSRSVQKAPSEADHKVPEEVALIGTTQKQEQHVEESLPDCINLNGASAGFCQNEISQETSTSKRCKLSDAGEDPHPQRAKRTCLGRPPATRQTYSAQTSRHDPLPLPPLPPVEAKAESKASPVSECKKTTLEVELLTPGKRAQRLSLTSNNTAETNQNRLAASLRGLTVKPASSGSSIGSRSTLGEEGSENVPRTSRLRRLKRSWGGASETGYSKDAWRHRNRDDTLSGYMFTPCGLLRWLAFVLVSLFTAISILFTYAAHAQIKRRTHYGNWYMCMWVTLCQILETDLCLHP